MKFDEDDPGPDRQKNPIKLDMETIKLISVELKKLKSEDEDESVSPKKKVVSNTRKGLRKGDKK